jgi:hypothetical protein
MDGKYSTSATASSDAVVAAAASVAPASIVLKGNVRTLFFTL